MVIQFYSNIDEKHVGKSPQEIPTRPTFRNILTNLKKQDKTKMELPLDIVSISASSCRTKWRIHYMRVVDIEKFNNQQMIVII